MSGEIDLQRGFLFNENDSDEVVTVGMLNKLVGDLVARISAGSISNREIADGTISADKLSVAVNSQLGVADGSITRAKIVDDAINGDKIEDDAIASEHIAADSVVTSSIIDEAVTADKLAVGAGMSTSIFRALMSSNQSLTGAGGWTDLDFDSEDYDLGSDYDEATNQEFVAPVDGVYLFEANIKAIMTEKIDVTADLRILKNGSTVLQAVSELTKTTAQTNINHSLIRVSWLGVLAASDTVKIQASAGIDNATVVASNAWFQGFLIRRTA